MSEIDIMNLNFDFDTGEEKANNIIKNFFYLNRTSYFIFPNKLKKKFYFYNYNSTKSYSKFHYYKIFVGIKYFHGYLN